MRRFKVPLSFALIAAILPMSACATVGDPSGLVDVEIETESPSGFRLGRPQVVLVGGEMRVRGALCRKPLSIRRQPHGLIVTFMDSDNRALQRRTVPVGSLPVHGGARCVYYSANSPAELGVKRVAVRPND